MKPHHTERILFDELSIRRRIPKLAEEIAVASSSPTLDVIGILRGSFIFLADLVREFHVHHVRTRVDFIVAESYGVGTDSSGQVRLLRDFDLDVRGSEVLLVDDILDTGRTLAFARDHVRSRGARRVRTCVLLDKPARRVVPIDADHVAFVCPNEFVVGYGLDYEHWYRDLPWIAAVTFTDAPTSSGATG